MLRKLKKVFKSPRSGSTTKSPDKEDHPDIDVVNIPVRELEKKVRQKAVTLTKPMISKIRDRFISMSTDERREYYWCGKDFLISEQIQSWQGTGQTDNGGASDVLFEPDALLNSKVALWHSYITNLELDVIAIKAWGDAISRAAGQLMDAELATLQHLLDAKEIAITAGYFLSAKYLFHLPDVKGAINYRRLCTKVLDSMKEHGFRTLVDKIVFYIRASETDKHIELFKKLMHTVFPVSRTAVTKSPTLPAEILRMDNKSIHLYKKALSEGETSVHSIRVMVVGHYGVGKTTLTKRLLEEDVDLDARDSTDGIDVHVRRCRVSLADQKWTVLKKDEKVDNVSRRLAQVLAKQSISDTTEKLTVETARTSADAEGIHEVTAPTRVDDADAKSLRVVTVPKTVDDADAESLREVTTPKTVDDDNANTAEALPKNDAIPKTTVNVDVTDESIDGDTNQNAIMKDLKDLISNVGTSEDNDNADVSFWDFAGQSVFYNTHQSFLSSRAIYLLVADVSKHINDVVGGDKCYFDIKGAKLLKIHEFFNLWLNSIHALCPSGKKGMPPVILVGTHADKLGQDEESLNNKLCTFTITQKKYVSQHWFHCHTCKMVDNVGVCTVCANVCHKEHHLTYVMFGLFYCDCGAKKDGSCKALVKRMVQSGINSSEQLVTPPPLSVEENYREDILLSTVSRQEQETKYFKAVRNTFNERITAAHVVYTDIAINNAIGGPNLARLRQEIYKVAAQQDYWGEKIPAKWLTLERALGELRDKGLTIITRAKLWDVNNSMPVPIATEEYLDLFLRFHHDTSNILYFNDADLRDHIVLDPQWLIDSLKSLITADMFRSEDPQIVTQCKELRRDGILTHKLIDAIWNQEGMQKFLDYKDHLLQLMKKLNLIAQIDEQTHDGCYLVPGMLTKAPANPPKKADYNSTSDLCITTSDDFLPVGVFQRLLAGCVSNPKWKISKQGGSDLIYCGYGCFQIDLCHRMTLYFSACTIQMWVSYLGTKLPGPNPELCAEVREYVQQTLQKINTCLSISQDLELSIKCPDIQELNELPVNGMFKIDGHVIRDSVDDEIICHACAKSHAVCCSDMLRHWYGEHIRCDSDDDNCTGEKILTDKQLSNSAAKIGKEYQQLGFELGLSHEKIDQIKLNNPYDVVIQTTKILLAWKESVGCQATCHVLEQAMVTVGIDTTTALAGISDVLKPPSSKATPGPQQRARPAPHPDTRPPADPGRSSEAATPGAATVSSGQSPDDRTEKAVPADEKNMSVPVLPCDICGANEAFVVCHTCDSKQLCIDCNIKWHKHPKRQKHSTQQLAGTQLAPHDDTPTPGHLAPPAPCAGKALGPAAGSQGQPGSGAPQSPQLVTPMYIEAPKEQPEPAYSMQPVLFPPQKKHQPTNS